MTPKERRPAASDVATAIARLVAEKKGRDIRVLNVADICSFTDMFVMATADSTTQLRGIVGAVFSGMKDMNVRGSFDEVRLNSSWGIMDYGDVVVHVFVGEARQFYNLERLWGDAAELPWAEGA